MRILNISAQKPDSTGSGVYLAEMVRCELSAGHAAAVVAGVDASDEPTLPEGVEPYFVRFNTETLPFNVCGMSDVMPYFGAKSIGRFLSQCQSRSRTADIPVGFLGHRVCGGLFRIGHAFPHKNLRLQGYSFRLHPARATLTPYTATPRSTTNSASSSFCARSVCPICLEGEATLAYLQRVRHSAPSLDVSFLHPYSLWVGDSSRDSYWKPNAKGACAYGPKGGMPPSHEGESNMADNREMWQSLGMDLETHDQLCAVRSPASSMPRKLKTAFPFLAKIACS